MYQGTVIRSPIHFSSSFLDMARGKGKASAKNRICSDEFIVDDDDDAQSCMASDDEYIEEDSVDEFVFYLILSCFNLQHTPFRKVNDDDSGDGSQTEYRLVYL